ncbi:MAG: RNA polymerase sigma factor, partial [Bacteroidota bacterium]
MKGLSTVLLSEATPGCPRETELVRACQQKRLGAEERLYKHFYGYVMSISLRYASGRDEAQEITDDSFMKAFAGIDKFDTQQSIKPWLRRIVINTAVDYHRKN